jgi:peptidoglycan/LPS O-acetylase OafA/YrhL
MRIVRENDVRGAQRIDYRPDIDGLRAISVLAVVLFHAFPGVLPGGFIGVDVFFVISGFLITKIISDPIQRGRFSAVWFYRQRVLRIFPALIIVLAATYAFGWASLYADEFKRLALNMIGGETFTANIVLWMETGYFDVAAATKPLLHLWSLGVEEQFYILWPLLLIVGARLRVPALAAISLLAALSFAIQIATIGPYPTAAFFLPFGRMWEVAAGGLLAVAWSRFSLRAPLAHLASILGFAAIIGASLLLSEGPDFPGWRAAVPVVGAVAVIASGPNAWVNRSILQRAWMVEIGRISYPVYLWHWVLLSFSVVLVGGPARWTSRAALVALSFLASWATYFFIERWMRNGRHANTKAVGLSLAMLALVAVAFVTWKRDGLDFRRGSDAFANVASASLGHGSELAEPRCLVPPGEFSEEIFCLSDRREPANVLLWGDSKAQALYYGILSSSSPGRRWSLVGRWGCAPFLDASFTEPYAARCARLNEIILGALDNDHSFDTIVLAFSARYFDNGAVAKDGVATPPFAGQLDQTIDQLQRLGKKVVLVIDNPSLPDPRACMDRAALGWSWVRAILGVERNAAQITRCDLPLADHLRQTHDYRQMIAQIAARRPGLIVYDPTQVLCDTRRGTCPMVLNRNYLYSYGSHISDSASALIAKELLPLVGP